VVATRRPVRARLGTETGDVARGGGRAPADARQPPVVQHSFATAIRDPPSMRRGSTAAPSGSSSSSGRGQLSGLKTVEGKVEGGVPKPPSRSPPPRFGRGAEPAELLSAATR